MRLVIISTLPDVLVIIGVGVRSKSKTETIYYNAITHF
jgi:hypothetical protein